MARLVALLRGINVGGHRKVPMARLREVVGGLGHGDVRTYVQSGNVVFTAQDDAPPADVAARLEAGLAAAFGFDVAVVVRTAEELAGVVAGDPLREVATDPARHLVLFLGAEVDAARLAGIEGSDFAAEQFRVAGREIHVWAPQGVRDSRLLKALSERRLGVTVTVRNRRTVEKLLALAGGAGGGSPEDRYDSAA